MLFADAKTEQRFSDKMDNVAKNKNPVSGQLIRPHMTLITFYFKKNDATTAIIENHLQSVQFNNDVVNAFKTISVLHLVSRSYDANNSLTGGKYGLLGKPNNYYFVREFEIDNAAKNQQAKLFTDFRVAIYNSVQRALNISTGKPIMGSDTKIKGTICKSFLDRTEW